MPSTLEIISYSGVDPSLKQSDFDKGVIRSRRYRNRRIGEFLKELNLTEGRGTGIPTIKRVLSQNGSDAAKFDTNEPERSFFVTELLIHPDFLNNENIGGSIGGSIELTLRQEEVLNIVRLDNKISYRTIAKKMAINESAAKKHLNTLKEKGWLKRVDGTRGYWKVNNKGIKYE